MSGLDKIQFLRQVPLFRSLSDKALLDLSAITIEQTHPPKSLVFKEGDKGDALYMLKQAKLITETQQSGVDSILVHLARGTDRRHGNH
jgi:hypothetical protein